MGCPEKTEETEKSEKKSVSENRVCIRSGSETEMRKGFSDALKSSGLLHGSARRPDCGDPLRIVACAVFFLLRFIGFLQGGEIYFVEGNADPFQLFDRFAICIVQELPLLLAALCNAL